MISHFLRGRVTLPDLVIRRKMVWDKIFRKCTQMTPDIPMNKSVNVTSYKPDTTAFDAVFRYPRKTGRYLEAPHQTEGVADVSS